MYSVIKLYMFRTSSLPNIRSLFSTVHSALVSFMQVFDNRFQAESGWNSLYVVVPYRRVCFVQFLCGVSILTYFLCLFGIDELYIHVTVHRNRFLFK